jgi:hypothetical protein
MSTQAQITEFLEGLVADWPRQPLYPDYATYQFAPQYQPYPVPVSRGMNSQQVAESLLASAEFRALKFGTWLQSPDGQLIAAAVEALSPPPLREDVELLVDALTLAATSQQEQGRSWAVFTGIAASVALGLGIAAARSA